MFEFFGFLWAIVAGVFGAMPWWVYLLFFFIVVAKPAGKTAKKWLRGGM